MTKDERQKIGIKSFISNKFIGCFDYVMRFGKTLTAIKIIDYYLHVVKGSILIVVPSSAILEVWKKELDNYKTYYNDDMIIANGVKLYTVNTLLNTTIQSIDLLIVDEIHKFTSDKRLNLINNTQIKHKHILGLTGSYPYNNIEISNICPVIDKINEQEAIRNNWISNFIEYNISLDMTDEDKSKYIEYSNDIKSVLEIFKDTYKRLTYTNGDTIFKNDFDLILACYSGRKIQETYVKSYLIRETLSITMGFNDNLDLDNTYYKRIFDYWSPVAIKNNVTKFYNAMRKRNVIHNINEVKIKAVLDLYIAYYNKNNIITFNESIVMADYITDSINNIANKEIAVSYHSKIPSRYIKDFVTNEIITTKAGKPKKFSAIKQLEFIKQGFKLGIYNMINTVNAVDEGFNLELLDVVITTSGTVNPVQYEQRSARGKTIDYYNPNKVTTIINLYFDDFIDSNHTFYKSRDKSKLRIRQNNRYIPMFKLEDFIKYIKNN